jgi:hypothetical protein
MAKREEQRDAAIQTFLAAMDCFGALAMTISNDYRAGLIPDDPQRT